MNESVLIALVDQIKELNANLKEHNEIQLSHYIATGQIELEQVEYSDLDS